MYILISKHNFCIRALTKRGNVGIFPKSGTPLPSPQFGNPMFVKKKKYGLFCILGPFSSLFGWYYGL